MVFVLLSIVAQTIFSASKAECLAQRSRSGSESKPAANRWDRDLQIAKQFAPIIYQGLGDNPRGDYITNFDFDGDWKGDNNWKNLDNTSYKLNAWVYYSVIETSTHYFVHYATFHPRDYKGGLVKSQLLDLLLKEGMERAGSDPTGMADDVALSHENDLEGCLVVALKPTERTSAGKVQYVETVAHNRFLKYYAANTKTDIGDPIEIRDEHPVLFSEPKGHGMSKYTGDPKQLKNSVNKVLVYSYGGRAEDPEARRRNSITYDLTPIYSTLWEHAQDGENPTYGEKLDYKQFKILTRSAGNDSTIESAAMVLGSAFRGNVGFKNKARPPWGWFDETEKDRPAGEWFFDPADVIKRHFQLGDNFSVAYLYNPYLKIE